MVARSPPKDEGHAFSKTNERSQLLRETVKKVDRAMARLQELQYTVRGSKVHLGVTLSPRSTRGYMRMSLRCKQESLRIQGSAKKTAGDSNEAEDKKCDQTFNPAQMDNISPGHWRRWSLPAAIVQQAVGDILEASNFAKEVANIVSDSIGNKLLQDPKTPQSAYNGTNLLEEITKTDTKRDCKVGSVDAKDGRSNAQGYRKFKHRHYTLSDTELQNNKATQSSLTTPPGKRFSLIGHLQEEGFDGKSICDKTGRLNPGNEGKKLVNNKSQKVVYKFRMVTPEKKVKALCYEGAASSLELRRKAEKQQARARARAELTRASSKVQCQMSFRASNRVNECGKNARALASALVSCCTSPTRTIDEQIGAISKILVKVDQITPARKPRIAHHMSTKAIMFPNPTFVPSPSDCRNTSAKHCQRTRCTACATAALTERRKSLPSLRGFSTPKFRWSSPLCKENVSAPQKIDTLKPPSNLHTPKIKKPSPPSKLPIRTPVKKPIRTIRQSPMGKASAASNPSRNTPCPSTCQKISKFHKFSSPLKKDSLKHVPSSKFPNFSSPLRNKTPMHASSLKYPNFFSPLKNKSSKHVSPSKFPKFSSPFQNKCPRNHVASAKKPVCFRRSHNALCSELSPVTGNISLLPKQQVVSPIQPLPSLISKLPSRRRRSYSTASNVHYDLKQKVQLYPAEKGAPDKTVEIKGAGSGRDLSLPPAWGVTIAIASIKDSSSKSSKIKSANSSLDEMPHQSSVLECGRSISCPKQRPLKAVDNIANSNSIGNRFSTADALDTKFSTKRKDRSLQGKENQVGSDKQGQDAMLKKSNRFLRRSWSVGHENIALLNNGTLNNGSGGLPFLKSVRGWMNMRRAA